MQNPLVSVMIITYNQKEFLKECIESCLAQDYPNTEIVVADDASTDGTQEMLKEYAAKMPGKFVLRLAENNQGITKNSNLGLSACSGEFIAIMGGDDLMLPGKISKQVKFMQENKNCAICYHNLEVFDSDTGRVLFYFNSRFKPRIGTARQLIKHGCFNGACANMIRRSMAPGVMFDERLPVVSDFSFWVDFLENSGGEICYINEILGKYRKHKNNITNQDGTMGQKHLDYINQANLIIYQYPKYFDLGVDLWARNLASFRKIKEISYIKCLLKSFFMRPNIRVGGGIVIYFLSFGKIKL